MPIIKDSTPITAVRHRTAAGSETTVLQVIHVTAGGVQTPVFGAQVTTPSIQTNTSLTHNIIVFRVRNTYDLGVTLTVSVRTTGGTVIGTQSLFAEAAGVGGYDPQFTFTELTSAQSYIIRAIGTLSGHADSQAHELNFTTPVVYTTVPTISNVSQTWNTINWRLTNADTATATITTALFAADQNTQIGTTKTISLASGAFYDFSQNSLSYSTNYYIKRTAHASADGKLQPGYTTSGPYTTAAQPQTPTPTVVLVSKTSRSIKVKIANNGSESATIYYRVGESGSWTTYGTVASETYTADINLTATATGTNFVPSTNYTIYAKALITGWAESAYDSETVTTNKVLVAPTIVYGSVTGTSISWYVKNNDTLTVDMGSNVNSTSSWPYYDNLVPYNTNSTLFTETGLTSGLTYTVYAQAIDTTGTYDSSGIVELNMTTTPTAAVPTLTFISATSSSLTFSVKNNDTSSGSYYWYLSDWSQSSDGISIGAGATVNLTIGGLSPSTTYTVLAYMTVSGEVDSAATSKTGTTLVGTSYAEWRDVPRDTVIRSGNYQVGSQPAYPSLPGIYAVSTPYYYYYTGWSKYNMVIDANSSNNVVNTVSEYRSVPDLGGFTVTGAAMGFYTQYTPNPYLVHLQYRFIGGSWVDVTYSLSNPYQKHTVNVTFTRSIEVRARNYRDGVPGNFTSVRTVTVTYVPQS